ncbi:hypothetical protein SADUNF_Sadunf10G0006100 [Salix dunnii]|uniref:Uncharacterized protein n=1 Tax=Salix dunnii TaxID=1413687 RepID=A0A835JRH9_9ROSI|nr:hypothetical protein SADUNF_Sadunf10G0006100 [Salix dunnii]
MSRQTDRLARIGLEGFAAIDELFGQAKGRPPVRKVPTYYIVHQVSKIPATEVIDSNEAAQRYKGKIDRLARIGLEGFAAIDELFGQAKGRPPVRKVPTYYIVHQVSKIPATEVIDSNEAAQRYKGKVHTDYRGKPVPF